VERPPAGVHDPLEIARVGTDQHTAREQVAGIEPADGLEVDEALVGDVADEKADPVHVTEQHDLLRRGAGAGVAPAQQRAQRVDLDRVEEALDLARDEVADPVLVPRHAGRLAKDPQEIETELGRGRGSLRPEV